MVDVPKAPELEKETSAITVRSKSLAITSDNDLTAAGDFLRQIKTISSKIDAIFKEPAAAAHRAHKAILAARNTLTEPLVSAEREVKQKIGDYELEQARVRAEEERRLREAAAKREEERMLSEAVALEAEGKAEAADVLLDSPVVPHAPLIQAPKVAGVSTVTVWNYRIVDPDLIPRKFMIPDDKKLAQYARAMGKEAEVPGCEFFEVKQVRARKY